MQRNLRSIGGHRRKYFFDISALLEFCKNNDSFTGIQRVVAEIIPRFSKINGHDVTYVSWLEGQTGTYKCLPFSRINPRHFESPRKLKEFFFVNGIDEGDPIEEIIPDEETAAADDSTAPNDSFKYPLARYSQRPVRHFLHRLKLDLSLATKRKRSFKRYGISAREWKELRNHNRLLLLPDYNQVRSDIAQLKSEYSLLKSKYAQLKTEHTRLKSTIDWLDARTIEFEASAGDYLFVLDASWSEHHARVFDSANTNGMNVCLMVHDLIPILFPGTTAGDTPQIFAKWLAASHNYTSIYLANSENTRRDLEAFLKVQGQHTPVKTLLLAQDVVARKSCHEDTHSVPLENPSAYPDFSDTYGFRPEIRKVAASDYALCVGTIEPRKNLWRIAAAWKKLLDEGLHDRLPRLVFAGRRGWLRGDFEDLMAGTGNLYGWAEILEGPTDYELDLLYRRCRFFIKASLYEGWGLPVGEALSYGKTGVVSNVASLPEVGGDLVEYCCPTSIDSISDAVRRLACEPERREELEAKIRSASLRTWADVAVDLAGIAGRGQAPEEDHQDLDKLANMVADRLKQDGRENILELTTDNLTNKAGRRRTASQ